MKKEDYTFLSADDEGTMIHAVRFTGDGSEKPRAVILLIHGMIENIGRYEEFASFLTENGFVVLGHDHIGHGDSVRDDSRRGIIHSDSPAETMVEDVFSHYRIMCESYPGLPHFILGHSMGSYLVRMMLTLKSGELDELSGAVIVGTGTEKASKIRAGLLLDDVLTKLHGRDYQSRRVSAVMFGGEFKRFDLTGEHPENSWLSKNTPNVIAYHSDPKCRFVFSLNAYRALLTCAGFVSKKENIQRIRKDLPVLFISGSDDPVGQMGDGVKKAVALYHEAGIEDISMKLFSGDRHEILNETDRADVYRYILRWLNKRRRLFLRGEIQ